MYTGPELTIFIHFLVLLDFVLILTSVPFPGKLTLGIIG